MNTEVSLFFILLGCRPDGRKTEQHDVFAGIGTDLQSLKPAVIASWPEAKGKLHLDAWRKVCFVDGYRVRVMPMTSATTASQEQKALWFVNLGGYASGVFEEFHQKLLLVAENKAYAIRKAKSHPFFAQYNLPAGGAAHIDDKWLFDVDDVATVESLLPEEMSRTWRITLEIDDTGMSDNINVGYFKLSAI